MRHSAFALRPRRLRAHLFRSAALAAAAFSAPALAQSVDYAGLEQTFGEPVTTSANGKPQRRSDSASALVIITRDDIRRSPAREIPDLLKLHAGVDVNRWTAGHTDVGIRGGSQVYNPRLLVLVNGRQVYLDHYGMTNWSALGVQLEEIQQVEVVRGPGSALFGFNAASGVVNIVTVSPLQTTTATGLVEGGDASSLRATVAAAFPVTAGVGLRLSAGYERLGEFDNVAALVSRGTTERRRSTRKEAAADLNLALSPVTEAVLGFTRSDNDRLEFTPILEPTEGRYRTMGVSARLTHDTGWGALTAHAYRNALDVDYLFDAAGNRIFMDNDTTVGSLSGLIRLAGGGVVRVSGEYRRNELRVSPGYPGATAYDVVAGSAMWERPLGERATVTLAGRVDRLSLEQQESIDAPVVYSRDDFDRTLTEWSANAAVLFRIDGSSSLRAALGRGVQAPSLLNFGFRFSIQVPELPFPLVAAGDPATHAARVDSMEIGYRKSFDGVGVNLDLTGFYNRASRVIVFPAASSPPRALPPRVPFILVTGGNVGGYEAYGLEASLDGRLGDKWRWLLNYTWLQTDDDVQGNAKGVFRQPLAFDLQTPTHRVNAQLSFRSGPWLATAQGRYASSSAQLLNGLGGLQPLPVRQAVAIDAKLEYAVTPSASLFAVGDNLTDASGATVTAARGERRARVGVRIGL